MKREEFIKICGILGVGLPLQFSFTSCSKDDNTEPFKGKVIIIGAGAGGLSAGYLLHQQGTDFEILEASTMHGGRMRVNREFSDFPIPLGAEWIETNTSIFQEIVNDSSVNLDINTIEDAPDRKFVNYSWYDFFEQYIYPSISSKISYNAKVNSIDYSGNEIVLSSNKGQFKADRVIISVPLKILKDGDISFSPDLPKNKLDAINSTTIWEGFKAFFEFTSKFYDDEYVFNIEPFTDGQKLYYNASLGQNTSRHILGLFAVGKPALDYISLTGGSLKDYVLSELDSIYSNQATPSYIKHIYQNWNDEPFIRSGYMTDYANWRTVKQLGKAVSNKIFFSGGAYTDGEDWVSVHAAALSAKKAIKELNTI